jgi:integral membrane protein (TIGR01906 family)
MRSLGVLSQAAIGLAAALVIVTVSVLPFLTPQWIAFEQSRAEASAWTGFTPEELRTASDSIVRDLVFGPPAFDVQIRGEPVLAERERGHMRDVRTVFTGLWILTGVAIVALASAFARMPRAGVLRAVRGGAFVLVGVVVVLGIIAAVAFDTLFELFHRILFPSGSYTFDPTTDRLVQLFPFRFWEETALVVGAVIVGISLGVGWIVGRRLRDRDVAEPSADLAPARAVR